MNKIWNWLVPTVCALALAACGGGGGPNSATAAASAASGASSGGTPTSIDVIASAATLGTGASDSLTITATVKDSSNVAIAGAPVKFATDSGSLTSAATVTTASGQATATLAAGSDKTNRSIVVTVTSGTVTGKVTVAVVSATAASVDVVSSSNRVGTGGSAITITAVVKTANNVTLAGAPIQFSADTGNLVSSATATDANGSASATFSGGADRSNRTANITVVSGAVTGKLSLVIDGTTISVSGPSTLILGTSADLSFKVTDSTGAAIAGQAVAVTGTLGNVPANFRVTTDSAGTAKYAYTAVTAGTDTVSIVSAGVTSTIPIAISSQTFAFLAPVQNATVSVGASQPVTVRYLVNGAVPSDGVYQVRFTSTAGTVTPSSTALTAGQASVALSSSFAGPGTVQATVYAPAAPNVAVAQASTTVQFAATTPSKLILQTSPSAIGPNSSGSTTQQAEVRATVIDANFNPVAGVVVNFTRLTDTTGGNLSQASATTDVNGIAKVQYVSGGTSSATDGVTLQAAVATNTAVTNTVKLIVSQNALFIGLGQGNDISNVNPQVYLKQWTAYVTDSTGAPVPNVTLTISAIPTRYAKGTFAWDGKLWSTTFVADGSRSSLSGGYSIVCASEDAKFVGDPRYNNGLLDTGEDFNGSLKLEPGNVISVNGGGVSATVRTDATGFATINLQYAESYAYWVEINLKVAALVAGTESSNTATFFAPGSASDYSVETTAPAGQLSPFGVAPTCSDPR